MTPISVILVQLVTILDKVLYLIDLIHVLSESQVFQERTALVVHPTLFILQL